jgi:hypothetical protein
MPDDLEPLEDHLLHESTMMDQEQCGFLLDDDACDFFDNRSHTLDQCVNYMRMRRMGESHRMAKMLATGVSPALRTDKEFRKGMNYQFAGAPALGDRYKAIAEAHGLSTNGLVYIRGLARFPGDPAAWISGRGDVVRIAKERGWGVSGSVNIERREVEPPPDIEVADDIVGELATELVEEGMDPREATELARDIRSGKIDNYNPDEHMKPIPPEGLEYCPDLGE